MNRIVTMLPKEAIADDFDIIAPFFEEIVAIDPGRDSIESIARRIVENEAYNVWCVIDTDDEHAYYRAILLTEIIQWPGGARTLRIDGAAGTLDLVGDSISKLKEFAAANYCDKIELFGRPGWERVLKDHGFAKKWVVCEVDLK